MIMRRRSTIVATLHMRPKPISPEQREDIFVHMAADFGRLPVFSVVSADQYPHQ